MRFFLIVDTPIKADLNRKRHFHVEIITLRVFGVSSSTRRYDQNLLNSNELIPFSSTITFQKGVFLHFFDDAQFFYDPESNYKNRERKKAHLLKCFLFRRHCRLRVISHD